MKVCILIRFLTHVLAPVVKIFKHLLVKLILFKFHIASTRTYLIYIFVEKPKPCNILMKHGLDITYLNDVTSLIRLFTL